MIFQNKKMKEGSSGEYLKKIYVFLLSILNHSMKYNYLSKSDYQNLDISFKKLIILYKYEDTYICTFDRPTNPERIIINSNEIMNRKIHYSDDFDLFSELKIYNKLKERLKFGALFVFLLIILFLISLIIVITGLLFTISELPFFKSLSLDIFIISLFFIMLIFVSFFITINFRIKNLQVNDIRVIVGLKKAFNH